MAHCILARLQLWMPEIKTENIKGVELKRKQRIPQRCFTITVCEQKRFSIELTDLCTDTYIFKHAHRYTPKHAPTNGLFLMCLCNVEMLILSLVSLSSSHINPIYRQAGKITYTLVCHRDRKTNVRAWKSDRETHRQMTDDQTDSLNP